MSKKIICIKIGGKIASQSKVIDDIISEIKQDLNHSYIFIHGGGAEVTQASKAFGIEAKFENGIRQTGIEEMKVVDGVLSGKINKQLVRQFHSGGIKAVGLSGSDGSVFTGEALNDQTHTGKITAVDTTLLHLLADNDYLPIIASTSMCTKAFKPLNINADDAALAIASEIKAEKLIFISDILGVLKDEKVIPSLNEKEINKEIEAGIINGGMIPKVKASLEAVKKGSKAVVIGTYQQLGDLSKLLKGKSGTIIKEEEQP